MLRFLPCYAKIYTKQLTEKQFTINFTAIAGVR